MRFLITFLGFFLVFSLCNAAIVPRRTYRNTEEIFVPVAIIQDGEEIKGSAELKQNINEPQTKSLEIDTIAEAIAENVAEEQKLEPVEAAVQAERRIDEAIVEEEIKEAVREEQNIEASKDKENNLGIALAEEQHIISVPQSENSEELEEPAKEIDTSEKSSDYKAVVIGAQTPTQVVVIEEASNESANDAAPQPEGTVRQATEATPTQTTTQQNFVQQFIQNSPLGQFFNQITGQSTTQTASDSAVPAPAPTLPGLFNPVTAVQTAAQSVVNSTSQAFQGLQQFASNLGNQFQSTLSGLGGQQQEQIASDATTARPPGPIQQLVNTFIGTPQPTPTQQGPLQGFLNIFQGNNRPQGTSTSTNPEPQPSKEPEIQEAVTASIAEQENNEVRGSGEANDSFEESVQPNELIVVNDDASQTENDPEQNVASIQYK